jgi:hypothetical protein
MTNNLKTKSSNRQKVTADDFNQTIVNIMGPARLKDLCPVMREAPGAHQERLGEQRATRKKLTRCVNLMQRLKSVG